MLERDYLGLMDGFGALDEYEYLQTQAPPWNAIGTLLKSADYQASRGDWAKAEDNIKRARDMMPWAGDPLMFSAAEAAFEKTEKVMALHRAAVPPTGIAAGAPTGAALWTATEQAVAQATAEQNRLYQQMRAQGIDPATGNITSGALNVGTAVSYWKNKAKDIPGLNLGPCIKGDMLTCLMQNKIAVAVLSGMGLLTMYALYLRISGGGRRR